MSSANAGIVLCTVNCSVDVFPGKVNIPQVEIPTVLEDIPSKHSLLIYSGLLSAGQGNWRADNGPLYSYKEC